MAKIEKKPVLERNRPLLISRITEIIILQSQVEENQQSKEQLTPFHNASQS